MPANVNLDALIPREDFEVSDAGSPSVQLNTLQVRDFEPSFFYSALRKPDFQRETSEWEPHMVHAFVKSFIDGDLIPAVILWRAGPYTFVIDGAHRLSALISWVQDDYGDGPVSRTFFQNEIPTEQGNAAKKTRDLINSDIGSYAEHQRAASHPDKALPDVVRRARAFGSLAIQVQWVTGDAAKAEASFFKINQRATPIDKTEIRLLQLRHKPNAIAARAIIRSGTGHKYWSFFKPEIRNEIEAIAREINTTLFSPELKTPIKTLDLPIAGRGYSAESMPLIVEFVNLSNGITAEQDLPDDVEGAGTINCLKNARRIVSRAAGLSPGSLGLHPAVYFYGLNGRYQPTAFLTMMALVKDFEQKDYFAKFIDVRSRFEQFLIKYKQFVNQVVRKFGSGVKGYPRLQSMFWRVLEDLGKGLNEEQLVASLTSDRDFSFLQAAEIEEGTPSKDFSAAAKSAVFLKAALAQPMLCTICGGYIHGGGATIDHIVRRQDGGVGSPDNGQLAHPFCNTGIKN